MTLLGYSNTDDYIYRKAHLSISHHCMCRAHAEFQLNEEPNYPFWFTPSQLCGRLVITTSGDHVHHLSLAVPTERHLNVGQSLFPSLTLLFLLSLPPCAPLSSHSHSFFLIFLLRPTFPFYLLRSPSSPLSNFLLLLYHSYLPIFSSFSFITPI